MHIWEHLFLTGEFSARARLLSGLMLKQVTLRPEGASHSIYDEPWHAATWQRIVVERNKASAAALLCGGANYPSAVPEHEQQWHDLVQQFLEGAQAAAAWAQAPERLAVEEEPGVTMSDICTGTRRVLGDVQHPESQPHGRINKQRLICFV